MKVKEKDLEFLKSAPEPKKKAITAVKGRIIMYPLNLTSGESVTKTPSAASKNI